MALFFIGNADELTVVEHGSHKSHCVRLLQPKECPASEGLSFRRLAVIMTRLSSGVSNAHHAVWEVNWVKVPPQFVSPLMHADMGHALRWHGWHGNDFRRNVSTVFRASSRRTAFRSSIRNRRCSADRRRTMNGSPQMRIAGGQSKFNHSRAFRESMPSTSRLLRASIFMCVAMTRQRSL